MLSNNQWQKRDLVRCNCLFCPLGWHISVSPSLGLVTTDWLLHSWYLFPSIEWSTGYRTDRVLVLLHLYSAFIEPGKTQIPVPWVLMFLWTVTDVDLWPCCLHFIFILSWSRFHTEVALKHNRCQKPSSEFPSSSSLYIFPSVKLWNISSPSCPIGSERWDQSGPDAVPRLLSFKGNHYQKC